MSRPRGSIIGAKPTWTTTATSGIWTLRQAEEMQADEKWPRGPVAPTSVAGTPADTEVALTWTAPATTHGTITDYAVEYTPSGGSPTVVLTGSTAASYTVTGLTNDTEYTFRVRGINHTPGDWSESVAVTPSNVPTDPDFADVTLLLHMDGTNGSTTFTDSSNNGIAVTANGDAQVSTAQTKFGQAAYFDGSGDYLSFGAANLSFGTDDFTVEMWIYPTSSQTAFLADWRLVGSGPSLYIQNNVLNFYDGGALNLVASSTAAANQWTHVAAVRSGGTLTLYQDGVSVGSMAMSTNMGGSGGLTIAKHTTTYYTGYIDDLRITKGVARYTANFTPPTAAFPDQ